MSHPDIWQREGLLEQIGVTAAFAMCKTDDGKLTYWGYDPRVMTFEQASQKLVEECRNHGLRILPRTNR